MAPKSDNIEDEAADPDLSEPRKKKKKKRKKKAKKKKKEEEVVDDGWKPQLIVSNRTAWLLAAVSIVLCPISFAGYDIWPLAFVAWVPLIIAMRGQTPRRAAYIGWFAGFGMTMIGFYWLISMLETFSGFPKAVCALFAAILCLEKGGRIAFMGWMYARATQRGWHHALSFLGAFAVSELLWPVLFPWYFGAAMHNTPIMMQTADLGGVIMVSVVVIAVNVAIAELGQKVVFSAKPDRRTLIGGALTLVFALGYGGFRLSNVESVMDASEPLKIGMVQGNRELKNKLKRPRAKVHPLQIHLKHSRDMANQGADLVVWSEAAARASFDVSNYETEASKRIGKLLKTPTIIGVVLREPLDRPNGKGRRARYFNSALMVDDKGAITGRYDKYFLLMFGEYLPFGDDLPFLYEWSPNSGAFSKGTTRKPLTMVGDHQISVMICYEDIIPSYVTELVDAGEPELFVNMTNDAWFGATIEPWQHLALAKFRSVEHRKYMARVTNTGMTAMIDPLGRVTATGSFYLNDLKNTEGEAILAEAHFMKMGTLFTMIGEKTWWLVALLMGAACFVRRKES